MADDPEQLTFKFDVEGAEKAHSAVSTLLGLFHSLSESVKKTAESMGGFLGKTKETREGLQSLSEGARTLYDAFERGGSSTRNFGQALSAISSMLTPSRIAMGALVIVAGTLAEIFHKSAEAAKEAYLEIRQLQSISGMAAKEAEDLKDAFELAGVESGSLTMAFFRLGNQIETGGKELQRLGIEFRDSTGRMKNEGELLLEVRDKISSLGDSTARNTALMELFGRSGRALGPAFAQSREEFQKYIELAEKNSAVTDDMMKQTAALVKEQKSLEQASLKTKIEIAQLIGIPFEQTMIGWQKSLRGLFNVMAASSFGDLLGFGGGRLTEMRKAQEEEQRLDTLGKAARQIVENRKGKREEEVRLTQAEIAERERQIRVESEINQKRLASDSAFEAERLKMQEGAGARAIDVRMRANAEMIREQNDLFEKTVAQEKRRSPVGIVDKETMYKLTKERDEAVMKLEEENRRLGLERRRAAMEEDKRVLDDGNRALRTGMDERVLIARAARDEELGANKLAAQDSVTEAARANEITVAGAKDALREKLDVISKEEEALRAFAAKYPDLFEVQRDAQNKLRDLQQERVRDEVDANSKVLQSRRDLIEKLRAEADKEAGLGGTLADSAVTRIRKRNPKASSISQADIDQEIERMRGEGESTAGQFAAGGAVSIDALQEAIRSRGMFRDIAKLGTTTGGATGLLGRQMQSQFADPNAPNMAIRNMDPSMIAALPPGALDQRLKSFMPTNAPMGLDPSAPERLSAGFQKVYRETLTKTDEFLTQFNEKIQSGMSGAADSLFKSFMDKFIRQLEFEASRQ